MENVGPGAGCRFAGLAIAALVTVLYCYLAWLDGLPIMGGDHAAYLLMADHFSPFSDRATQLTDAVVKYIAFPPLFPALLGILGGTSAHMEWAHVVTTSFLLIGFAVYFRWVQVEVGGFWLPVTLAVVFALMPASLAQSLGIMSEGLYLALTLAAILLVSLPHLSSIGWYGSALLVGLAPITRTVGVTLVIAFAIYMFFRQTAHRWRLIAIALAPIVLWNVYKLLRGYQGEYLSFLGDVVRLDLGWITNQLLIDSRAIWLGWVGTFDLRQSMVTIVVVSIVALVCLAGTVARVWERKLDGIYVATYLVFVVLWPFPQEAKRLLYVVTPILLLQGLWFVRRSMEGRMDSQRRSFYLAVFPLLVIALSFRATAIFLDRAVLASEPGNHQYRGFLEWYQTSDLVATKQQLDASIAIIESMKKASAHVSPGDCVYHVDPASFMLYSNRQSRFPPFASDAKSYFRQADHCRYHYVGAYTRPPYREPFYPATYILNRSRPIVVEKMYVEGNEVVLGMLLEYEQ